MDGQAEYEINVGVKFVADHATAARFAKLVTALVLDAARSYFGEAGVTARLTQEITEEERR